MAQHPLKHIKSKYLNVSGLKKGENIKWLVTGLKNGKKGFKTEREAAIFYDKHLISQGKQPINILKPI